MKSRLLICVIRYKYMVSGVFIRSILLPPTSHIQTNVCVNSCQFRGNTNFCLSLFILLNLCDATSIGFCSIVKPLLERIFFGVLEASTFVTSLNGSKISTSFFQEPN